MLILCFGNQRGFGSRIGQECIEWQNQCQYDGFGRGLCHQLENRKIHYNRKRRTLFDCRAPGDTLLFSAIHLKEVRFVLEKKDFQADFVVKMESSITSLKEVVVKRYDNINAVDLGISPKGILHRTQAERRLYTAKSTPVFVFN